jgi:hypothetical protein
LGEWFAIIQNISIFTMPTSSLILLDNAPLNQANAESAASKRISQLYEHLELYSEGQPAQHTLFVLQRTPLATITAPDRLLIIDPPPEAANKFHLQGEVAALSCLPRRPAGFNYLQTMPGGLAHLRIGQHFLDIYSQRYSAVVVFPTLGIVYGGPFGGNQTVPELADGSDASDELEALRLLARLVKQRLHLFIPHSGDLSSNPIEVMAWLAEDVSYLHKLRRVIPSLRQAGEAYAQALQIADSLLPDERRTLAARTIHERNVQILWNSLP